MGEEYYGGLPVDAGDDVVHLEGGVIRIVLTPYPTTSPDAIVRGVEGVVDGDDDGQKPGDGCQNLVCCLLISVIFAVFEIASQRTKYILVFARHMYWW